MQLKVYYHVVVSLSTFIYKIVGLNYTYVIKSVLEGVKMIKLYENIKKYRLENRMSQSTLAEKVGYADKGMISRIEHGKIDLSQSQIEKFAEVFNVSPAKLIGWDNEPTDTLIELASKYSKPVVLESYESPNIAGTKRYPEHIERYAKILPYLYKLNEDGLRSLTNYAELLLHDEKYIERSDTYD